MALVEAADLKQYLAPRGGAVSLYRLGVAGRDLVEVLEVGSAKTPRPRQAHAAITERLRERTEKIAGDLGGAIEHEEHAAPRQADERVSRRALAQIAVREVRLDAAVARGDLRDPVLRLVARARIKNEHLAVRREKRERAGKTSR